ncbi:hypothetical protein HDU83_004175 [Entophlyctis luteolus]|nr:hypothetical protein HDU82_008729 [Entophlyctis luteolus]KAJ3355004.1 hypothetical protein HDU83_004175 [Entophlyctis luteolus]
MVVCDDVIWSDNVADVDEGSKETNVFTVDAKAEFDFLLSGLVDLCELTDDAGTFLESATALEDCRPVEIADEVALSAFVRLFTIGPEVAVEDVADFITKPTDELDVVVENEVGADVSPEVLLDLAGTNVVSEVVVVDEVVVEVVVVEVVVVEVVVLVLEIGVVVVVVLDVVVEVVVVVDVVVVELDSVVVVVDVVVVVVDVVVESCESHVNVVLL